MDAPTPQSSSPPPRHRPDPFAPRPDTGLSGFVCPDGEMIDFSACLKKCRMAQRCAPRPVLAAVGQKWQHGTGAPSTTELISPTRIAWLRRVYPYYESVASRKWALLGTAAAAILEDTEGPTEFAEERLADAVRTGRPDQFDAESGVLLDWKFVGAWSISSIIVMEREVPGEVFRSGPRKGLPKMEKVEDVEGASGRIWAMKPDWAWQLESYRLLWQQAGFKVNRSALYLLGRDSGGYARQLGLSSYETRVGYEVTVPPKPDAEVQAYLEGRRKALGDALASGECPPICTPEERWNRDGTDTRCDRFCAVRAWCDRHGGEALRGASTAK